MGRPPTISRQQILEAARGTFAASGFEGTTLATIAGRLKVTPAALLRHFDSKQALFLEAMRMTAADLPPILTELEQTPGHRDPRIVLRRLAEDLLPFIQAKIGENIAVFMHRGGRGVSSITIPVDLGRNLSNPRVQLLAIVTGYFRRAAAAEVLTLSDPRAAALLFLGSIHSYVFFHSVLRIVSPPYPLPLYIDSLLELWSHGGVKPARKPARRVTPHGGSRGRQTKVAR